tara:strand:+ start:970 stop:1617 length:648 start_codon:yes stop_codon:yes gene_type:complete
MRQTVLIADDSPTIQRVVALALSDENVDIAVAETGKDAIKQIKANQPSLVLADTRMPDGTGYEVAEFVASISVGKRIPIVLMSGAFETLDEERAKAAGCVAVLVKPFEPKTLVRTVHELLGNTHQTVAASSDQTKENVNEERVHAPSPDATSAISNKQSVVLTDETLDQIVSHVFEKMSDRVIRETVGKIVSRVAEQMVRDELERLKDKLRSDDA